MKVKIGIVAENDVEKMSRLILSTILFNPHYSNRGKAAEVAEYSIAEIKGRLGNGKDLYLTALVGGEVVGFCHGFFDMGTFWINWIGVDPVLKHKKVATKLMDWLENYVASRGGHKIWFDTKTTNVEAIGFFLRLGCRIFGTVSNHWYGADFYFWEKTVAPLGKRRK